MSAIALQCEEDECGSWCTDVRADGVSHRYETKFVGSLMKRDRAGRLWSQNSTYSYSAKTHCCRWEKRGWTKSKKKMSVGHSIYVLDELSWGVTLRLEALWWSVTAERDDFDSKTQFISIRNGGKNERGTREWVGLFRSRIQAGRVWGQCLKSKITIEEAGQRLKKKKSGLTDKVLPAEYKRVPILFDSLYSWATGAPCFLHSLGAS